jgi:hypothetical protein
MSNKEDTMKISTTDKDLIEKLNQQILKNVEAQLSTQDLNDEEKAANLVLAKRAAIKDAEAITNLVVQALA